MSRRLETFHPALTFICSVLCGFVLLSTAAPTKAQERDPATASGLVEVGVDVEFDELAFRYAQRLATTDGFDGVRRWQHDLRARYDFASWFRAGVGYRLSIAPEAMDVCCRHRVHGEGSFRFRGDHFRLAFRTRVQLSTSPGDDPRLALRQRVKGTWVATDVVRPFAAAEFLLQVAPEVAARGRFDIGVGFRPADAVAFSLFYRLEIPESPSPLAHVAGLECTFTVEP